MGTAPSRASELQWRRAGATAAASIGQPHAVAAPAEEPSGRSVVVRRERVAHAGEPFDPFDASLTDDDAAMPAAGPAAQGEFDPFEEDDAEAQQAPAESEPTDAADLQQAFDEPHVDQPPTAEELEQAQEAIDREIMRREAAEGAAEEMAAPPDEAEAPQMEDELAAPGLDDQLMEDAEEEDSDLELQFGPNRTRALTPEEERIAHAQECEQLYEAVRADTIKNISLDIRLKGTAGEDYPLECTGRHLAFQPRAWAQTVYLWKAAGLCHKPLYFEQVQLERYGHDWGPALQPLVSGAHFFGTVPILPYKMGLETPQECVYALGYYRPGSCAPYMIEPLGFTWRAAAFQAGAVTGAAAAIP